LGTIEDEDGTFALCASIPGAKVIGAVQHALKLLVSLIRLLRPGDLKAEMLAIPQAPPAEKSPLTLGLAAHHNGRESKASSSRGQA
jgi:hypothetical protein